MLNDGTNSNTPMAQGIAAVNAEWEMAQEPDFLSFSKADA